MDYGSTTDPDGAPANLHKFTIDETDPEGSSSDQQPLNGGRNRVGSCCSPCLGGSGWYRDGLKMIVISSVVLALGITVALIVQIQMGDPAATTASSSSTKVVSDDANCSALGEDVMASGGNAVDASIATAFCLALVEPHISGLGGGGLMLLHQHRTNDSVVVDFRETVPESARNGRFAQSTVGRPSVGVPGFVKGLEFAHKKYGSGHVGMNCCSWSSLIYRSIRYAMMEGLKASKSLSSAVDTKIAKDVLASEDGWNLRKFLSGNSTVLTDNPMFMQLVKSLQIVANEGPEAFYEGRVGKDVVAAMGGTITLEDLAGYRVVEREPIYSSVGTFNVISSPAPSSGPKLLAFLNAMERYRNEHGNVSTVSTKYLEDEAKILLALQGMQLGLGDPSSNPAAVEERSEWMARKDNAGEFGSEEARRFSSSYSLAGEPVASHVAAMDGEDNYVSMVLSLNTWFGSAIMTDGGVLLNSALSNFFVPNASARSPTVNRMSEDRRPLTQNVAAFAMDTRYLCGRRILTGGASADAVGQVLMQALYENLDMMTAVDAARIMVRNGTLYLEGAIDGRGAFPTETFQTVLQRAETKSEPLPLPYAAVNSLVKNLDTVLSYSDLRSQTA